jgi:hypothetical protein
LHFRVFSRLDKTLLHSDAKPHSSEPSFTREAERRPDLGLLVARERFELSALQKCGFENWVVGLEGSLGYMPLDGVACEPAHNH